MAEVVEVPTKEEFDDLAATVQAIEEVLEALKATLKTVYDLFYPSS